MKPERWKQVDQILEAALEREPGERAAFLAEACGSDEVLRREVGSLLDAHARAGNFIEVPVTGAAGMLSDAQAQTIAGSDITIGSKLGHYEIKAHLGSGSMGVVYRATDLKLGRSVAIKILPDAVARDSDRIARFGREARVLASLNHPHIAVLHGLEESGGRDFLVMELIGGETLADRIRREAMPVADALAIAKQIAEALEAAHEKGIVHRDLKPSNIKITADSQVKVLDFGLAKAFTEDTLGPALSDSPALTLTANNEGMILGTAPYMSPEQAKGLSVDKRTDIFAFGSVLYEMLTGSLSFPGENVREILARVIEREPDFTRLPANLHPRVAELVRRCLEKDPRKRRRDMGDICVEIEQILAELARPAGKVLPSPPNRPSSLRWIVMAVIAIALLGMLAARYLGPTAESSEMRVNIVTPATPDPLSFAISPDGHRLVFVASGVSGDPAPRLWLRPLNSVTAEPLAGTEGASHPFWSYDSLSVGFFAGGYLKRIDVRGGLPKTLAEAELARGGSWSPDDVILFAPGISGPLFQIPAARGVPVAVTKLERPRQLSHRFPQFLPGGKKFLFYVQGPPDTRGIYLGSMDGSEQKRLIEADTAGLYAPSGWLLFVQGGTLQAKRFDLSRAELTGDPVNVAERVGFDSADNLGAFSVSASGLMIYRAGRASRRQLTWFDRSGKMLGTFGEPDETNLLNPELSPDGLRVAVERTVFNNTDVWVVDADRATRFTFDTSIDHWPIWSPDGNRIVFDSNRTEIHDLYRKTWGESGKDEALLESMMSKGATDWSADGRFILYDNNDPSTEMDIWVLPMDGDRKPWPLVNSVYLEHAAQFSPDGNWVAYQSNESGGWDVYIRRFPGPGGHSQVSTGGGISPRWRHDGKELYYIGLDSRLMAAPITKAGATLGAGTPVALFQTRIVGGSTLSSLRPQYDVAPDGRFLINTTIEDTAISPTTLVLNWKPPVK
jgi:eukaryotic-like serine/threonine-protein kinase